MVRAVVLSVLSGLLSLGTGVVGWTADADGGKLTIVSPTEGAVIKGDSVRVRYIVTSTENINEGLKGRSKASHAVRMRSKIVAVNHKHEGLVAEAAVTIEVE